MKNGHNFVMFKDQKAKEYIKNHFKDSCNRFVDCIEVGKTWQKRRLLFVNIILKIEAIRVAELKHFFKDYTNEQFSKIKQKTIVDLINKERPNIEKKKYKNSKNSKVLDRVERIRQLNRVEQLQQLAQINGIESLKKLQEIKQLKNCDIIQQLENLERLKKLENLKHINSLRILPQINRIENIEKLSILKNIEIKNKSYENVLIPYKDEEVIIYCDPPYKNTGGYKDVFDFNKFNNWFLNNNKTIFMSEYESDFFEIFRTEKRGLMKSAKHSKTKIEKLFCNKNLTFKNQT